MNSARSPTSIPTDYSPSAFHRHLHWKMPQSPTTLRTDYSHSTLHKELHWKCHTQSPTTLQTDSVCRHLTETFPRNATHNHRWLCGRITFVGILHNHQRLCRRITGRQHLSAVHNYWQIHRRTVRIPKGGY
jgi:hypothetical protein